MNKSSKEIDLLVESFRTAVKSIISRDDSNVLDVFVDIKIIAISK